MTGLAVAEHTVAPGDQLGAYHYEYGNEEWLLVVEGTVTVRHDAGVAELVPGDLVCFPEGPAGARGVANPGPRAARVLVLRTTHQPSVILSPEHGTVAVSPPGLVFNAGDAVGPW